MSKISSIGFKRQIRFWAVLVFFAVAAWLRLCPPLVQNGISSLSLDQENLDILLIVSVCLLFFFLFGGAGRG
ncbi:MAG TPA: hypothetical protein PK971_09760, partial [Saprospiraceae bacterium]|nr:hypothetical protein [Saprospiraceae bacterium]